MKAIYLNAADYAALVQELPTGTADSQDRENAIRINLGERLDHWPDTIRLDRDDNDD